MGPHAKIRSSALAERCESGRIDMLGKHASRQRDRGFESHPLRHNYTSHVAPDSLRHVIFVRAGTKTLSDHLFGGPRMRIGAGPCAMEPCEPRQVRKEATVSSQFRVPQDHLAPLLLSKLWKIGQEDLLVALGSPICLCTLKSSLVGRG